MADDEHSGTTELRGRRDPLVLSVTEAAGLLGISKDLAYDLVARGELPSIRLGRRIVIPTKALVEFIDQPRSVLGETG